MWKNRRQHGPRRGGYAVRIIHRGGVVPRRLSLSLSRARVSTDNGVFDRAMSGVPTGFDIRARTDTPIERCYTRESYRKPVLAIALHTRARLAREYSFPLIPRAWSDRELFRDHPSSCVFRSKMLGGGGGRKIRSHGYIIWYR